MGTEETAGARGDVNGRRVKTRDVIVHLSPSQLPL